MENISFIDKINEFTEEQKANVIEKFVEFLKEYTEPSFGSISKRDINIKIFNIMRDLKLISEDPDAWEIINKLKLTRTKASGLLYDANICRKGAFENLDVLLRKVIEKVPYINDKSNVLIQIDNPLLIDHIKSILKEANCLSDGSFSPEIVRMSPEAFMYLYIYTLEGDQKIILNEKLNKAGKIISIKEFGKSLLDIAKIGLNGSPIDKFSEIYKSIRQLISKSTDNEDTKIQAFFEWLKNERKRLTEENEYK